MTQRRDVILSPRDQGLKAASDDLVAAVGGSSKAAGHGRLRQQAVSDACLPNVAAFLPVDVVADLERVAHGSAGWPQVTRRLAALTGHVLVATPEQPEGSEDLLAMLARLAKEYGEASAGLLHALGDGRVSPREARALLGEAWDLVEASARLHAQLAAIAGA